MQDKLPADDVVLALKAAAEPTRLRILKLLFGNELNVKDLTQILGQSQPRLSRHLKLLNEAGLIERFREGSWVYYFVSERSLGGRFAQQLVELVDIDDVIIARDLERVEDLKREREAKAQEFFQEHANEWDKIRALHVSESSVEKAMLDALGDGPFNFFVDLGTGTGRMLELFSERFEHGLGIDANHEMLSYARSNLAQLGLTKAQVRHGDIYNLALGAGSADAVVMHQVLHFLSDPQKALTEAGRILAKGGKLLVVDFAPHDLEILRDHQAHDRLGFQSRLVTQWLRDAGLTPEGNILLKPDSADDPNKLTVSIWMASRAASTNPNSINLDQRLLEEAQG